MRKDNRRPSIRRDVDSHDMKGLCESQQEEGEEDHEIEYLIYHCNEHGHKEVQLPEHPHQVDHLYQRKKDRGGEHYLCLVQQLIVFDIKNRCPNINYNSQ